MPRRFLFLPLLLLLAPLASGQEFPGIGEDEPKLSLSAELVPAVARAQGDTLLKLRVQVVSGWHVYGSKDENPIRVELRQAGGLVVGAAEIPPGKKHATGSLVNYWLSGDFEVTLPLQVPADLKPGVVKLEGVLHYLPCDPNVCLLPAEAPFSAELKIEPGQAAAPQEPVGEPKKPPPAKDPGEAKSTPKSESAGLWTLLAGAIGAGIFALLMPCTYPMIPITISFFTKQAADRGGNVLPLALTYGAGIIAMFIGIGILIGPAIVTFATHWLTNLIIALLFAFFALVLFGVITLLPPRFLMDFATKASLKGGYGGVFLMGATLVVTSFTCTAPFVGSLLAIASDTSGATGTTLERYGRIAIGMGTFGLTMAIPFVFLSLVPGKLKTLPRSGEWMNTLKIFLGFVEVAASLKFFSNVDLVWQTGVLPRELFLLLWAGTFGVGGLFLLGLIPLKAYGEQERSIGPQRMVWSLVVLGFAAYCLFGAMGNKLDWIMTAIAPNYSAQQTLVGQVKEEGDRTGFGIRHTIIKDDYPKALAEARASGKKVLVNLTGFT